MARAAPTPGLPLLRIVTFGLRFCQEGPFRGPPEDRPRSFELARYAGNHKQAPPAELVAAALQEAGVAKPGDTVLAVDCRLFTDPDRSSSGRHLGVHPRIIDHLVRDDRFPPFFSQLKGRVARAWSAAQEHHAKAVAAGAEPPARGLMVALS